MLTERWWRILAALLLVGAVGVGCDDDDDHDDDDDDNLVVQVTDAPFPAGDDCLAAATIDIDRIELQAAGAADGEGFVEVPIRGRGTTTGGTTTTTGGTVGQTAPRTIDLLQLRNGAVETIARTDDVPAGTYQAVRVRISRAVLSFRDGSPEQTFAADDGGVPVDVRIPLEPNLIVTRGGTSRLLLDVDLARSFTIGGGGGGPGIGVAPDCDQLKAGPDVVTFEPVVRALDRDQAAMIQGTVTAPDETGTAPTATANVEVIAFPAGSAPATTTPTASTFSSDGSGPEDDAPGRYRLFLPAGTYDLYLFGAGQEAPVEAAEAIEAPAGSTTDLDLAVPTTP